METYTQFKSLLLKAIGDMTRASFAETAGVTPEYISRSLKDGPINKPTRSTLKKLAAASAGKVSYEEFLQSCGYELTENDKATPGRPDLPDGLRINRCVKELIKGFTSLGNKSIYPSFEDYLDDIKLLYSTEDIEFDVSERTDFGDKKHPEADGSVIVTISWGNNIYHVDMDILVWVADLTNGHIIVIEACTDKETLKQAGSKRAIAGKGGTNAVYEIKLLNKTPKERQSGTAFERRINEFKKYKGMNDKQALMAAIFGDPDKPKRMMSVEGIGIYLDDIPEFVFRNFLKNHEKTFCMSEAEKQVYKEFVVNKAPMGELFKDYATDENFPYIGLWYSAIYNIIKRETGIDITLWKKDDIPCNRPVLMLDQRMPWEYDEKTRALSREDLIKILDPYARELRRYVDTDAFHMLTNTHG